MAPGRKDRRPGKRSPRSQRMDFGTAERLVRINPVDRQPGLQDLNHSSANRRNLLPKIDSADTVHRVSETIARMEKKCGWPAGGIALIVIAETARAILRLETICAPRSGAAVIFWRRGPGSRHRRSRSAGEWKCSPPQLVVLMPPLRIQALIGQRELRDLEALYADARQAAGMGFAGKQIIHPAQIDPVQRAFTPSEDEVRQAQD